MASHEIPVEVIAQQKHGDRLRALTPWNGPSGNAGGNIAVMGHRDTVFSDGEAVRRLFTIRDGVGYGPAVADMKAGLVMNCSVLAAFAKFGGAPAPVVCLFTGEAAHSGANFADGISVIEELARKTQAIHALTDLARGITLNVGLIRERSTSAMSTRTIVTTPWHGSPL